jgi:hypothetical protein
MNPNKLSTEYASEHDWDLLRRSAPEDFDGHTGFDRMTPADRLEWLDMAVQFVSEAKQRVRHQVKETPL